MEASGRHHRDQPVAHNHVYGSLAPIRGVHVIVSGAGGHNMRRLGEQHHPIRRATSGVPTATRLLLRRGAAEIRQVDAAGRSTRGSASLRTGASTCPVTAPTKFRSDGRAWLIRSGSPSSRRARSGLLSSNELGEPLELSSQTLLE